MGLTMDEEGELVDILNHLQASRSQLSNWERNFLEDQLNRYAEHQSEMWLSHRQWAILRRIMDKVSYDGA